MVKDLSMNLKLEMLFLKLNLLKKVQCFVFDQGTRENLSAINGYVKQGFAVEASL